jgi:hypothetical protein
MTSSAYYFDEEEAERRVGRDVRNTAIGTLFGVPQGTKGRIIRAERARAGCWELIIEWETRYPSDRRTDRVNRFGYKYHLAEIEAGMS